MPLALFCKVFLLSGKKNNIVFSRSHRTRVPLQMHRTTSLYAPASLLSCTKFSTFAPTYWRNTPSFVCWHPKFVSFTPASRLHSCCAQSRLWWRRPNFPLQPAGCDSWVLPKHWRLHDAIVLKDDVFVTGQKVFYTVQIGKTGAWGACVEDGDLVVGIGPLMKSETWEVVTVSVEPP